MQLFVDFYVFIWFWLNLSDQNLKLFWTSQHKNLRFRTSKLSQKRVKTQKLTNNCISSFSLIEKKFVAVSYFFSCTYVHQVLEISKCIPLFSTVLVHCLRWYGLGDKDSENSFDSFDLCSVWHADWKFCQHWLWYHVRWPNQGWLQKR